MLFSFADCVHQQSGITLGGRIVETNQPTKKTMRKLLTSPIDVASNHFKITMFTMCTVSIFTVVLFFASIGADIYSTIQFNGIKYWCGTPLTIHISLYDQYQPWHNFLIFAVSGIVSSALVVLRFVICGLIVIGVVGFPLFYLLVIVGKFLHLCKHGPASQRAPLKPISG